jgi:succinate dehydrogenase / fumarate reductase, cytochrome b subunit
MAASSESLSASSLTSGGLWTRLWRSSVGKKYIVALTGLGLYGFVIIHMLGNLQVFMGPTQINEYAHTLKANPAILWLARLGLLAIAILHITATIQLAHANRRARPVSYAVGKPVASSLAQRTMAVSGAILLIFILFHLAHFTLGFVNREYLNFIDPILGYHDVRRMMIVGFSNPLVAIFYIVSMGLLFLHLSHGVSSTVQSLGIRSKQTYGAFDMVAKGTAALLFLGNSAIVLAILFGLVR